ncbi:polyphosphate kinase 2 family protein [Xanthobacter sp. TB0139]|uniref:polyphosphate kinase 2 family protein n=1 Tax=Xanthobacter sp. TB0139 TaxID=3459178 RepID=UPI004039241D
MGLRSKLRVQPGSKVRLKDIDASFHGDYTSAEHAKEDLDKNVARMTELQEKLYGEKKHALLIVLQGIDSAGKDGTCWHVLRAMNPQGTQVKGFKQPTEEELAHDFLWRVHPHVPGLGQVGVFNRSHYEDVLVVRVHDLVPKSIWSERYELINDFEKMLTQHNVTILKFFLYISPEEQLSRFRQRLDDPARQWKISEADYKERDYWDQYIAAYEDMLERCSTPHAPWYIIPSNHKWYRNLAVSHVIGKTLEDMKLKLPEPTVNLDDIRRKYHAAVEKSRGGN